MSIVEKNDVNKGRLCMHPRSIWTESVAWSLSAVSLLPHSQIRYSVCTHVTDQFPQSMDCITLQIGAIQQDYVCEGYRQCLSGQSDICGGFVISRQLPGLHSMYANRNWLLYTNSLHSCWASSDQCSMFLCDDVS